MEIIIMAIKSICDSCGMTLEEKASFCPTCGARMRIEEDVTADTAIPQAEPMNAAPEQPPVNDSANPALDAAMNNSSFPDGNGNIPPVPPAGIPPYNDSSNNMGIPPVPPSDPYNFAPQPQQPKSGKDTMALIGMILGIVAIVFSCLNFLDLPFAIAGLVLSILGIKSVRRKGMAIAGLVCSALAVVACIAIICTAFSEIKNGENEFYDAFMQGFEEGLRDELDDDYDDFEEYEYKYNWD